MNVLEDHLSTRGSCLLVQLCQKLLVGADVGLPIRYLQDLYFIHGPLDILLHNSSSFAQISKSIGLSSVLPDEFDDPLAPPGEVGDSSQIREGFFRSSNSLLQQAEFITEGDQEFSIPLPLVERKSQEATQIILCFFDLNKVGFTLEKYAAI